MGFNDVCNQKRANLWISRIIPVTLIAIIGYGSWVVTVPLCVDYLLRDSRKSTAVGLLFTYYFLLLLIAILYARFVYVLATNPGYVPRGKEWLATQRQQKEEHIDSPRHGRVTRPSRRNQEKSKYLLGRVGHGQSTNNNNDFHASPYPSENHVSGNTTTGMERFYLKDAFTCQNNGHPQWCDVCMNWKPDRAHHCREVGRCVYKMDHFCPWVGGVVSETNFKFFVQFIAYAMFFTGYVMIVMAVFISETGHNAVMHVHWVVALALSTLFFFFCLAMTLSSIRLILQNLTTIEDISHRTRSYMFAVHIPHVEATSPPNASAPPSQAFPYIRPQSQRYPFSTVAYPNGRDFAIVTTQIGTNPWDLSSRFENWKSVMGERWLDWFLPLKHSPCCDHEGRESMYQLNSGIQEWRYRRGLLFTGEESHIKEMRSRSRVQIVRDLELEQGSGDKHGNGQNPTLSRPRPKRQRRDHAHGHRSRNSRHPRE